MLGHSESIYEDTRVITFETLVRYPVTTLQVKTMCIILSESKACCMCLVGGDNSGP